MYYAIRRFFEQLHESGPGQGLSAEPRLADRLGLSPTAEELGSPMPALEPDHPALRARGLDAAACHRRQIGLVVEPGHPFQGWLAVTVFDIAGRRVGQTYRSVEDAYQPGRGGRRRTRWAVSRQLRAEYHLYNLDQAWPSLVSSRTAIVVEGPFDAIHLHRHGWTNAVALLGNRLSGWHVQLLLTVGVETVVLLLDNDHGGRIGRRWALRDDNRLAQFRVVDLQGALPRGHDPDDLDAGQLRTILELYRPPG